MEEDKLQLNPYGVYGSDEVFRKAEIYGNSMMLVNITEHSKEVLALDRSLKILSHIDNIDWLRKQKIIVQGTPPPQPHWFLRKNINDYKMLD